ncbi:hypothetical protein DSM21852_20400 [Methylocystis bryophila]|uniref:Uncharacterized protein n=1 Tax=Methylocystis bryophila TaxID=655015 RepID=A0A1W6MYD0_9HYPH|nr:hypothetical protein B1812_17455 [Methylocystis bryophila]BDV38787.1 hypothetical protein DSM21852_20400 [Methylocystis bryophila]
MRLAKKSARLRDVVAQRRKIEVTLRNDCTDGSPFDDRLRDAERRCLLGPVRSERACQDWLLTQASLTRRSPRIRERGMSASS